MNNNDLQDYTNKNFIDDSELLDEDVESALQDLENERDDCDNDLDRPLSEDTLERLTELANDEKVSPLFKLVLEGDLEAITNWAIDKSLKKVNAGLITELTDNLDTHLLDECKDESLFNKNDQTPLYYAVFKAIHSQNPNDYNNYKAIASFLLKLIACPLPEYNTERMPKEKVFPSPLNLAIFHKNIDVLSLLLNDLKKYQDVQLEYYICENNRIGITAAEIHDLEKLSPLLLAVRRNSPEIITTLIGHEPVLLFHDISSMPYFEKNIAHYAIEINAIELFKHLFEKIREECKKFAIHSSSLFNTLCIQFLTFYLFTFQKDRKEIRQFLQSTSIYNTLYLLTTTEHPCSIDELRTIAAFNPVFFDQSFELLDKETFLSLEVSNRQVDLLGFLSSLDKVSADFRKLKEKAIAHEDDLITFLFQEQGINEKLKIAIDKSNEEEFRKIIQEHLAPLVKNGKIPQINKDTFLKSFINLKEKFNFYIPEPYEEILELCSLTKYLTEKEKPTSDFFRKISPEYFFYSRIKDFFIQTPETTYSSSIFNLSSHLAFIALQCYLLKEPWHAKYALAVKGDNNCFFTGIFNRCHHQLTASLNITSLLTTINLNFINNEVFLLTPLQRFFFLLISYPEILNPIVNKELYSNSTSPSNSETKKNIIICFLEFFRKAFVSFSYTENVNDAKKIALILTNILQITHLSIKFNEILLHDLFQELISKIPAGFNQDAHSQIRQLILDSNILAQDEKNLSLLDKPILEKAKIQLWKKQLCNDLDVRKQTDNTLEQLNSPSGLIMGNTSIWFRSPPMNTNNSENIIELEVPEKKILGNKRSIEEVNNFEGQGDIKRPHFDQSPRMNP